MASSSDETKNGTRVVLKPLTIAAQNALHSQALVIEYFPFRLGRESRGPDAGWKRTEDNKERRTGGQSPTNDLYIWEGGPEYFTSREHLQIEQENGGYALVDRNSALGTWVEGHLVGGNRKGGKTTLNSGDVIIIGSHHSGFIFKFIVEA